MLGVGAVALPVPPVAAVYHKRVVPVAVKAVAVAPCAYVTGVDTEGAVGTVLPVVTCEPDNQLDAVPVKAKLVNVPVLALAVASVKDVTPVLVPEAVP